MSSSSAFVSAARSKTEEFRPLGEVFQPKRPRVKPSEMPDLPFIGMAHVEPHTMKLLETVPAGTMKSSAVHFQPGDVLYGRLRPYLNKVYRPDFEGLCSAEFIVFPKTDGIESRYLQYFLNSAEFVSFATHLNTGDRPRVDFQQLADYPFPLAPPEVQRQVVTEIEKQFSRLDEAVTNLHRVKANLKRYKAAVLKAAVEGRLVETEAELARREGRTYETGEQLLQRILEARRGEWKGKGKYKEPTAPDSNDLPELPERWCWACVDAVAFVTKLAGFEYTKFVKYSAEGDLAVIKAENAGPEGFRQTEFSRVRSDTVSQLSRSQVKPGDVLMVFVGAGTGNVARVPDDRSYFLGPNIAMIRVESPEVSPRYLELYLRSPIGHAFALGFAKAVAQPSLSMGTIRMIPVGLPELLEQNRIVAEVDHRFSILHETEKQMDANLERAEFLRRSILGEAFFGNPR